MGDYFWEAEEDANSARTRYAAALSRDPKNPELLTSYGFNQWVRGYRDSAVTTIERATALDPRSAERALWMAEAYTASGWYADGVRSYDRAIELAPDQYFAYFNKAQALLIWRGDVDGARATMQQAEARIGKVEFVKKMCVACFDWTGPLAAD